MLRLFSPSKQQEALCCRSHLPFPLFVSAAVFPGGTANRSLSCMWKQLGKPTPSARQDPFCSPEHNSREMIPFQVSSEMIPTADGCASRPGPSNVPSLHPLKTRGRRQSNPPQKMVWLSRHGDGEVYSSKVKPTHFICPLVTTSCFLFLSRTE